MKNKLSTSVTVYTAQYHGLHMLTNVSGKFHYVLQNKTKKLSICVLRFMRTKAVCMEDCFLPDIDCTTQLINNNIQ